MTTLVPMNRSEWMPWQGFRDLEDRVNRLFGNLGTTMEPDVSAWAPAIDLRETDDAFILEADLPGLTRDDIDLKVVDDVLTLKGERRQEKEEQKEGYYRQERSYGHFQRSFRIPGGIEGDKVEAKFDQGVLKVTLPKPEAAKPRQIEVKIK